MPEASDKEVDITGIEKFETAEHDTAVAQQAVTYGLQMRKPGQEGGKAADSNGKGKGDQAAAEDPAGRQQQQQEQEQQQERLGTAAGSSALGSRLLEREAAQLKEELAALPEQASLEAYDAMPVDQFGMALLR